MKHYYKIEISRKKFWSLLVPVTIGLVIAGVIIAYVLVNKVIMPDITDLTNKNLVRVPKMVGKTLEEARQACFDVGLRLSDQEWEYSDSVSDSIVLIQKPDAGERVKKGRVLSAIVSKGSEVAKLPVVKNLDVGPAKTELKAFGFYNIQNIPVYNNSVKKGKVIGTEPEGGKSTSREADVVLLVSKGKQPYRVRVPELIGSYLSEAKRDLRSAGLDVGEITYVVADTPGTIVSQSVNAGTSILFKGRVDLVVAAQ